MTDTENGPDASGSWQPDPTGRYRLRWQRGTGEWTGHVYSSEGELANDPYDTPPAPPSSSSGNETPGAGVSPLTVGIRRPRRSGRRKLLIAIGVIVALFVVLGIVGSLIEPDSDTTAGKSPPSTTTARTEATTTTTTRQAVTTTRQPSVSADLCQAEAEAMAYLMGEVELLVAQLEFEFGVGDQEAAQDTYDTIDWAMDGLPSTASRIINECRDYIPRSAAEDAQEAVNAMSAAWRQTKTACRADLAPLGFDC